MMSSQLEELLLQLLNQGGFSIGEVWVNSDFSLSHQDDRERQDLSVYTCAEDARDLVKYDDAGNYRPLKSAPNLKHGWKLQLNSAKELHLALDAIYPAALGIWLAYRSGQLNPVHFRNTVNRQTGMYRIVGKITDDQAQWLIAKGCNSSRGCLRTILWRLDDEQTIDSLPAEKFTVPQTSRSIPLLCLEACNLLVATGRKVVKGELKPED